jgi:hypothetical protein
VRKNLSASIMIFSILSLALFIPLKVQLKNTDFLTALLLEY